MWFDAVLTPHRSLTPVGFGVLMSALAAISFTAGMFFVLHGAWPVFGFFGLDVGLVYLAFKLNYRSGRVAETIRLDEKALTIARRYPGGQIKSWSFEPYWVQILMRGPSNRDPVLTIRSHGKDLVIGSFLTVPERHEVAEALQAALAPPRDGCRAVRIAGRIVPLAFRETEHVGHGVMARRLARAPECRRAPRRARRSPGRPPCGSARYARRRPRR